MKSSRTWLSLILLCSLLAACRADVAPDAGFLKHPEKLEEEDNSPLDAVWFAPGFSPLNYQTINVAAVDTTHLLEMSWWESLTLAKDSGGARPEEEVVKLAKYFRDKTIDELKKSKGNPIYNDAPAGKTLRLELALVEIVPTKIWLNALAYPILGALDHGAVAMEGRYRDVTTGKVVGAWKDRQYGQMSLISVADLRWYSHAFHTLDYWTGLLAEMSHQAPDQELDGRTTVTLQPW